MSHRITPPQRPVPRVMLELNGRWAWQCPICGGVGVFTYPTRKEARENCRVHISGCGRVANKLDVPPRSWIRRH